MSPNKVAVVTGANKGLGFAIVRALCKEYHGKVYLTSRDEARGLEACKELRKNGLHPEYFQIDIDDQSSTEKFVKHIQEMEEEIDILVNNAGILFPKDSPEPKLRQAQLTIRVNFFSLLYFTETVLPVIGDGARIVNISSSSGHLSRIPLEKLRNVFKADFISVEKLKDLMYFYLEAVRNDKANEEWGESPYVVSKVAVNAYTFLLHRRLESRGISVNCVHPGYVMSDMTRGAGNVTPEKAATLPVKLALRPEGSGLYVWHDGTVVPWDGPDPRGYIDNKAD